jgi:hypothetical protein
MPSCAIVDSGAMSSTNTATPTGTRIDARPVGKRYALTGEMWSTRGATFERTVRSFRRTARNCVKIAPS